MLKSGAGSRIFEIGKADFRKKFKNTGRKNIKSFSVNQSVRNQIS